MSTVDRIKAARRAKASGYAYNEVKPMSKDNAKEISDYFYNKSKESKRNNEFCCAE